MRYDAKHRAYTVGELAKLSGVTIRTLHHYDAIGLLRPASVGDNGYRHYGGEELLRLQQILFHRALGMSLADVAAVLDAPGFDRLAALRRQRERLLAEIDRHRRLLNTVDRTIDKLEGRGTMADEDLYKGFVPEKQAEYEAYIIDRYGEGARRHVEVGRQRLAGMAADERQAHLDELAVIEGELGAAVAAGVPPDDPILDPVLARHHVAKGAADIRRGRQPAYVRRVVCYGGGVGKGRPVWLARPPHRAGLTVAAATRPTTSKRRRMGRTAQEGTWQMQQQLSVITLGVRDLERSKRFYVGGFGWKPVFDDVGIVFYQMNGFVLGTWTIHELEADMQRPRLTTPGAFSLAHNVASADEVNRVIDRLAAAGGHVLRRGDAPPHGGFRGYVADPDDHAWEVAWNPAWSIDRGGRVTFGT